MASPPPDVIWDEFGEHGYGDQQALRFQQWLKDMGGKRKKIEPAWAQPGTETAVVYEDSLPWNHDIGICFEIKEVREYSLEYDALKLTWVVQFIPGVQIAYTRIMFYRDASEWYLDRLRREARLDILYRAHKDGVI